MSSKVLDEIVDGFGASLPIFRGELRDDGETVEFTLKDPYEPEKGLLVEDPVLRLALEMRREQYNYRNQNFEDATESHHIYTHMVRALLSAFLHYSELKNPKQTKLFKWLQSMDDKYNHPSVEAFVSLYRYAATHSLAERNAPKSSAHAKNMIAIMELIKDKYEDK
jgi:hypothetical protein